MNPRVLPVVFGLLAAALAGCGDTTAPAPLVGRHALMDVSGRKLPTAADPALPWGLCVGASLVGGSLHLRADGSFEAREEYLVDCTPSDEKREMAQAGTYRLRDDTIEYALPADGGTHVLVSRGLVTATSVTYPRGAKGDYRYRRR